MDGPSTRAHDLSRIAWYLQRLRSMSVAEMAWRSWQLGQHIGPDSDIGSARNHRLLGREQPGWDELLRQFRRRAQRTSLLNRPRAELIAARNPSAVREMVSAAEQVASGCVTFFGYPEASLGTPVDWSYDPINRVRWPQVRSDRIDHRSFSGDPKWIWELNRLQHLPWLAQAWLFTSRERFAELALDQLDSWMLHNPVGMGIAWRGAFEAGVRAITVVTTLEALGDSRALTAARFERLLRMLASSAERCWRDRSRFSSANNHLAGELAGVVVVAMAFPELRQARRWKSEALRALSAVASSQILPDGAGAEQALAYQMFTTELLLIVCAMQRARGEEPSRDIKAAVARGTDYMAALVGEFDPEPRYGDDDGGFALRLGPEPVRTLRDHLGIVGAFTGNDDVQHLGRMSLTAAWLQTDQSDVASAPSWPPPDNLFAPYGGTVVMRSAGRRLLMDVGPLGYLSIAAHGHADALAVMLSLDGAEVIGDPGTASYYGHPEWRRMHRGTRAHATVTVDDQNQSEIAGPFMWTRHAKVVVHHVDLQRGIVDAEHDGYSRLAAPVVHRRWLIAPPERPEIVVVDLIEGAGDHHMRVSWPLHPALEVGDTPQGHVISRDERPILAITYASAASAVILHRVRGDQSTNLGWWSDRLEARTPSWLVSGTCRGTGPLAMATILDPTLGVWSETDLRVQLGARILRVSWNGVEGERTVLIDRSLPGAVEASDLPAPTSSLTRRPQDIS